MEKIGKKTIGALAKGIKEYARNAGAAKLVIGVSGGVDSAACLALCAKAVGAKNIIAVSMPSDFTPKNDRSDAKLLCKKLGVKLIEIDMEKIFEQARADFGRCGKLSKIASGNLLARLRMGCLYAISNQNSGLVVGTGDKSEIEIGYFTKYGDGGCDFLPIGNYYKGQVREIALLAGVPEKIAHKPSSPRLWAGHESKDEIGIDYPKIDTILELLAGSEEKKACSLFGKANVEKIKTMKKAAAHKLKMPPTI